MKPYKTCPILKEKLWGGQKLKLYNKAVENMNIGESWETDPNTAEVPLLIKLIDANETLSIQVHPDDVYAKQAENQNNGKNEMWIILECDEDSQIVYGFNKEVDRDLVKAAIDKNKLTDLLNFVKVKKGDCIYIPAGTVHTLGKGILAYEVQQPSDLTYRLYDWNRKDKEGNKRELHVEKALNAINYSFQKHEIVNIGKLTEMKKETVELFANEQFWVRYFSVDCKNIYKFDKKSACTITIIEGNAYIVSEEEKTYTQKGDTWVIPKDSIAYMHTPRDSGIEFIETSCKML